MIKLVVVAHVGNPHTLEAEKGKSQVQEQSCSLVSQSKNNSNQIYKYLTN